MSRPWLSVMALGTTGGDLCADGGTLGEGVHLLWSLDPGLGFPIGGYDVWRRRHRAPEWVCDEFSPDELPASGSTSWTWLDFAFEAAPGPVRSLPSVCDGSPALELPGRQTLTVRAPFPLVAARAVGIGDAPLVELLDGTGPGGGAVIARGSADAAPDGRWSAEVWAEGTRAVRLSGPHLRVCSLCFGIPNPDGGWRRLTTGPLLVPLVPSGTANLPVHLQDRTATRAAAFDRLPASLSQAVRDRLADGFLGDPRDLVELLLRGGRDAAVPGVARGTTGRTAPRLELRAATALAAAALNPELARMLGLTWHDPVADGSWDYRVVAHHGPVPYPARRITFDDLDVGALPPGIVRLDAVAVIGSGGFTVLDGDSGRVLRADAPLFGAVNAIRIAAAVPAVQLVLDADSATSFTAWRGSDAVDTATAVGRVVPLTAAGGIDAVTWTGAGADLVRIELREERGLVGDLEAFAWAVAVDRPPPVSTPDLDVDVTADRPAVADDGTVSAVAGRADLRWRLADPIRDVRTPVVIQVGRSWRGKGADPEPDGPFTLVDPAHAVPATSRTGAAGPGGARTYRVVDAGWYAWRIRGVDAFGRVGGWGTSVVAQVRHSVDPPPPLLVSARYLDPADPYLSDADRALAGNGPGLLVRWAWPAGRRMQAPQLEPAGEFRVYLLRGEPNRVSGTATTAQPDGDLSRLTTDLTWPGAPDDLTGQLIRVGGDTFEIAGHGAGPQAWFDVRHRSAPLLRPKPGPVSLTLTAGVAGFRDLADPLTYDRRETVVPVGAPAVVTSVVTAVGSGADPTVTLAATVPAPGTGDDPGDGLLLSQGIAYRVTAQTAGTRVLGIAAQTQPDGSVLLPAEGAPATLWNAARYQAWLPGSLEPAAAEAFAEVTVAVTAADGDARVADAARWDRPGRGGLGSRPGREGPAAVAPRVRVPRRTPPPALTAPRPPDQDGDVPAVVAEPADWYGRAHWTVPLDAVPGVTGYRVLRAGTAALFDLDRRLRQTGAPPYAAGPFDDAGASEGWLAQHYPDLSVTDLTAEAWRDWSAWFYPRLSNRAVMDLADLDTHREVFGPAHAQTVPGPVYRDTIDGRGTGRFVYRVVTVDASGNAGPWSATFPIVEVRDVTAPKTPTLLSALGDENAAVLTWRANTEPDLSGYRVWRARTAEALNDVRRRAPYAQLPIEADTQAQTWTDSGLTAFAEYHYRVAAVDRAGNVSPPTPAARVRAVDSYPPDPPQWQRVERVLVRSSDGAVLPADTEQDPAQEYTPAVALAWVAGEDGVTCLVERRRTRERIFIAVTGWLTPTTARRTFTWLDPAADPRTDATYRIRARDAAGNEQRYRWNPSTMDGEGAPR